MPLFVFDNECFDTLEAVIMLVVQPTFHFPNITCAHSCHCSHYNDMAIIFYISLLVAQFNFSPLWPFAKNFTSFALCTHNLPCYKYKGQATYPIAPKQVKHGHVRGVGMTRWKNNGQRAHSCYCNKYKNTSTISVVFHLLDSNFLPFCLLHLFNLPCYKYQGACYMPCSCGPMLDIFWVCYEWSRGM